MTYEIQNLEQFESTTADLSTNIRSVEKNVESLEYILTQIKENWQNEEGQDILSAVTELENAIANVKGAIVPVGDKYVEAMNTVAAETRANQSRTML